MANTDKMSGKKPIGQRYKDEYSSTFPHITSSRDGIQFARCTLCRSNISIKHGGANDITKHNKSDKHLKEVKNKAENHSVLESFSKVSNAVIQALSLIHI